MNLPAILQRFPFLRDLWSKFAPSSNPAASESYYRGIEIMRRGYGLDKKPTVQKPIFDRSYIAGELDRDRQYAESKGDFSDEYQKYSKLDLEYGRVADGALDVLRNYAYLRKLILFHCGNVRDDDLAYLAELDKLTELTVAGTGRDGLFLQYVNPSLEYFTFKYSALADSSVQFFERFANIKSICLEDCGVGDSFAQALVRHKLNALWALRIQGGDFHNKVERPMLAPSLRDLAIINSIGCSNIASLFDNLPLVDIDLRYSDFSDEEIVRLLRSATTNRDKLFDFSGTRATDETLRYLAKSDIQDLRFLYLDATGATQKGINALAESSSAKTLWKLGLSDLRNLDLEAIISSFPKLREFHVSLDLLNSGAIPKKNLKLEEETNRAEIYTVKSSPNQVRIVFLKETYKRHHELVCRWRRYTI